MLILPWELVVVGNVKLSSLGISLAPCFFLKKLFRKDVFLMHYFMIFFIKFAPVIVSMP